MSDCTNQGGCTYQSVPIKDDLKSTKSHGAGRLVAPALPPCPGDQHQKLDSRVLYSTHAPTLIISAWSQPHPE